MKVKNFTMKSHLSMEDKGVLVHSGEIDMPNTLIHEKILTRTIVTPKLNDYEYGKPIQYFQIQGEKEFKGIKSFFKHYNIKIPKK
jgi:hypothetical protein